MGKFGFGAVVLSGLLFIILAAAGCGTASQASIDPGESMKKGGTNINSEQPAAPIVEPSIQLGPNHGTLGTKVVVVGERFPAGSSVEIRLGGLDSEATRSAYALATASQSGAIEATFNMPNYWPNGDPIVQSQLLVVASTPDFVIKATAVFTNETNVTLKTPGTP